MKCPKCEHNVSENDLSCPSCHKILKLKCPQCSTISKKNICPECDYTMLSKCFKCKRLNPTTQSNCSKCGMNIVASIALKEATISEFAVLGLEIVNFEVIKRAFDSKKTLKQFKDNLYNIIKGQSMDSKVRVQEMGNILIIRFCKDESFKTSSFSAVNFALNISQLITEINKKLHELKKVYLKIKINLTKGDLSDNNMNYEAGRSVEVIYGSEKANQIFGNIQILVDSFVYKSTRKKYPYQSLSSVFVKDEMITFYQLLVNKILKVPEDQEDSECAKLPSIQDFEVEEEVDDNLPIINLTEKKCTFIKLKPDEVLEAIKNIINNRWANPIINVKGNYASGKLNNINFSKFSSELEGISILKFCCTKRSRFYPFGLFRDIIKSFYGINEYEIFSKSKSHKIASKLQRNNSLFNDSIFLNENQSNNPDEIRFKFFEEVANFFKAINKKVLFVIEDFENIDRGSIDLFKYLIEGNFLGNAGFLISCDSDFYLHRHIYKLISQPNFYELELKLCSNKEIIKTYRKKLKEIEKTFFFRKIVENMKGSKFYFTQSLEYLVENDILSYNSGIYNLKQNKMIVIPPSLDELVKKRLSSFIFLDEIFKLYVMILLLGNEVPVSTLKLLNVNDLEANLECLENRNLIYINNFKIVKVKNYNLYKDNLLSLLEKEKLTEIAEYLCSTVISTIDSPHPASAECYEYAGHKKQAFALWNQMSDIDLLLGDFAAYINCCMKYLNLIEDAIEENEEDKSVEVLKLEIYEQISVLLYKHYPEKIFSYLETLVENAEDFEDDKRIKNLSNIMVQSCLLSGNYKSALEYIGKIISRTQASSFNPSHRNFNLSYYLTNLVKLEIYFNLGKLEECIELGDEIFKPIQSADIKMFLPQDFSPKKFKDSLKETLILLSIARIMQLKTDTVSKIKEYAIFCAEDNAVFDVLIATYHLIMGSKIELDQNQGGSFNLQERIIYFIYKMLEYIEEGYWEEAGNIAHLAKKFAVDTNIHQASLFLDLIIGFSYKKIGNFKKAQQIYYDILKLSGEKGLLNVTILNWYFLAQIELEQGNSNVALGILNKAISTIEKDQNVSNLFTLNFKFLLAQVFITMNEFEKAVYCANHSLEIAAKYNLNNKIPTCADLLVKLYEALSENEEDKRKLAHYQDKINKLSPLCR